MMRNKKKYRRYTDGKICYTSVNQFYSNAASNPINFTPAGSQQDVLA